MFNGIKIFLIDHHVIIFLIKKFLYLEDFSQVCYQEYSSRIESNILKFLRFERAFLVLITFL